MKAEDAAEYVKLIVILNDSTFRNIIPEELAKSFGFFQSKPATTFSPFAVTPDELGDHWKDGRLHLPLQTHYNDELFGEPHAGPEMHFSFYDLIEHVTKTRSFTAGTILGSGTVSNEDQSNGSSCLSEKRMIEKIETGEFKTPYMSKLAIPCASTWKTKMDTTSSEPSSRRSSTRTEPEVTHDAMFERGRASVDARSPFSIFGTEKGVRDEALRILAKFFELASANRAGVEVDSIRVRGGAPGRRRRAATSRRPQEAQPMEQVPVLEYETDDGELRQITQSIAIMEFLEETHPEPSLLPETRFFEPRPDSSPRSSTRGSSRCKTSTCCCA